MLGKFGVFLACKILPAALCVHDKLCCQPVSPEKGQMCSLVLLLFCNKYEVLRKFCWFSEKIACFKCCV